MSIPVTTQTWIATQMIPFKLAWLNRQGKVNQKAHLISTVKNLHEGSPRDTFKAQSMSLAMDWMASDKGLKAIENYNSDVSVLDKLCKVYLTTCFMNWLIDKQAIVPMVYMQLTPETEIVYDDTTISTKITEEQMFKTIHHYIETDATPSELFMYQTMLSLVKLEYSDAKRTNITNYPEGIISMKTYYNRREAFIQKLTQLFNAENN